MPINCKARVETVLVAISAFKDVPVTHEPQVANGVEGQAPSAKVNVRIGLIPGVPDVVTVAVNPLSFPETEPIDDPTPHVQPPPAVREKFPLDKDVPPDT